MPPESRFRLRPATDEDRLAVLALAERVADFDPPSWRTRQEIGQADFPELEAYFREMPNGSDLTIAFSDDAVAAGIVLTRLEEDFFTGAITAHLSVIAVAKDCVGKGLGSQLLRHSEEWAKSRGAKVLTLHVFDRNERAKGLYEARGFVPEMLRYRKALT